MPPQYLFSEVAQRVRTYQAQHPDTPVLSLGIGDVTRPIAPVVTRAVMTAATEMGDSAQMRGYGPEGGYPFLKDAIAQLYMTYGVCLSSDEIFVTDGAKGQFMAWLSILEVSEALMPSPTYPVYRDVCHIKGIKVHPIPATKDNAFLPMPPSDCNGGGYVIFLCSPANPVGVAYTAEGLKAWVDFALQHESLLIFDGAYADYLPPDMPHSIYEIEGANQCAIEVRSFSKNAGFTGLRCGYTIVPSGIKDGHGIPLQSTWKRYLSTTHNGVAYPIQRGAEAALSAEGQMASQDNVRYYLKNASILREALDSAKIGYVGGVYSPYLWVACPDGIGAWDWFEMWLNQMQIVVTPGVGFGEDGEGYVRLSAFLKREHIEVCSLRMRGGLR